MTQITKEQADAALNTLWITSESCNSEEHFETIKSYIAQLEANQRQTVSDEKLREAVNSAEFAPESMFGSLVLLPKQQWDVITLAMSEHASNRLPIIEEPAATYAKEALHWWMYMPDEDVEQFEELPPCMQEPIKRLVFYAKQRIESALPTPPAQEV